jgi:hypothetical protein
METRRGQAVHLGPADLLAAAYAWAVQADLDAEPQGALVNKTLMDILRTFGPAYQAKRLGVGLSLEHETRTSTIGSRQLAATLAILLAHAITEAQRGGLLVCRTAFDDAQVTITIGYSGAPLARECAAALFARCGADMSMEQDGDFPSGTWLILRLPATRETGTCQWIGIGTIYASGSEERGRPPYAA